MRKTLKWLQIPQIASHNKMIQIIVILTTNLQTQKFLDMNQLKLHCKDVPPQLQRFTNI